LKVIEIHDGKSSKSKLSNEQVQALKQHGFDLKFLAVMETLGNSQGTMKTVRKMGKSLMVALLADLVGVSAKIIEDNHLLENPTTQNTIFTLIVSALVLSLASIKKAATNHSILTPDSEGWQANFTRKHKNLGLYVQTLLTNLFVAPFEDLRLQHGAKTGK